MLKTFLSLRGDLVKVLICDDACYFSTLWVFFKWDNSNKKKKLHPGMSMPKPLVALKTKSMFIGRVNGGTLKCKL